MKLNPKLFYGDSGSESNFQVATSLDIPGGFSDLSWILISIIQQNYYRLGRVVPYYWTFDSKWVLNSYLISEVIYHYIFTEELQSRTSPFVLPPNSMKNKKQNPDKHWALITKYPEDKPWEITDFTQDIYIEGVMVKDLFTLPGFKMSLREQIKWDYTKGKVASFYTTDPSKKAQYAAHCISEYLTHQNLRNQQIFIKRKSLQIENYIKQRKGVI